MNTNAISLYYINLAKRTDRRIEIEREIDGISSTFSSCTRMEGVETPKNGAIGCAASHCKALQHFIFSTDAQVAIIFEDDFTFNCAPTEATTTIRNLAILLREYDVAMLAYNLRAGLPTSTPGIIRIFSALTTSGYMLKKSFAYTLLNCFQQAHKNLTHGLSELPKDTANAISAIDVAWQRLQSTHRFFGYYPALGYQRPSISDISNQFADYNV